MTDSLAPWWQYRADVDADSPHEFGVVDGDTLDLVIDLGFNTLRPHRVRLRGVDTAEIFGVPKDSDEYQQGIEQKRYVQEWIETALESPDWPLAVHTYRDKSGKYGRYVVRVIRRCDGKILNIDLADEYPEVDNGNK